MTEIVRCSRFFIVILKILLSTAYKILHNEYVKGKMEMM